MYFTFWRKITTEVYWEWFTWRVTDGAGLSKDISFWLEVRPTAPVPIEVTGTLSLTQRSLVTFTAPADMPTRLENSFVDVDGGYLSGFEREDNPTAPRMHNTLWYAFFNPDPGAQRVKISVPDNAWVTPAATNSVLRFGGVTLMSIEPVGVANDTGPFVVELTFSGSVTSLKEDDLMVTPMDDPDTSTVDDAAMIGDIAAVLGSDGKKWQVQITPVAGEATTIALASDSDKRERVGRSQPKETCLSHIMTILTMVVLMISRHLGSVVVVRCPSRSPSSVRNVSRVAKSLSVGSLNLS